MSSLGIYLDPALSKDSLQSLERYEPDIVIGIPSHRNGRTIGQVMEAVSAGIATFLSDYRVLLINADGGSSDNTTRVVAETPLPSNASRLITTYQGGQGKGRAILSILEAAYLTHARACVVLEAQAPGIQPDWVNALLQPVLEGADLSVGAFAKTAYASSVADNLAAPLFRLFANTVFRQPVCSEFCVSDRFTRGLIAQDVWETDVSRFGIGAWISAEAMASNTDVVQVYLGERGDAHCDPGDLSDPRLMHTASTIFRVLAVHRQLWQQCGTLGTVPTVGKQDIAIAKDTSARHIPALLASFAQGAKDQSSRWKEILTSGVYEHLMELVKTPTSEFRFPTDLWAQIVIEFAVVYNQGDGDPDRVAQALLPIYYARTASYIEQIAECTSISQQDVVEDIASVFGSKRTELLQLWSSYEPWQQMPSY